MVETARIETLRWTHRESVGSTNDLVLAAGRTGEAGGMWVTADRQLKGRGRGGRAWASEPGNFHGSLLYVTHRPVGALSLLPLAAGLGVRGAVAEILAGAELSAGGQYTDVMPGLDPGTHSGTDVPKTAVTEWIAGSPGPAAHRKCAAQHPGPAMTTGEPVPPAAGLALKWPNDVLLGGRKLAGILLESEALPGGRTAVAIGCGINLDRHPADAAPPATDLAEHGVHCRIPDALPVLARSMAAAIELFESEPARVAESWLAAAHGLGGPVRVRLPSAVLTGTFAGLDPSGRLILAQAGGARRLVSAGDVFFGAPAGEGAA